jgi:hypothetical protein
MIEHFAKTMKYRPEDSRSNYTLFDLEDYNHCKTPPPTENATQCNLFEFEGSEVFKPWPISERYLIGDQGTVIRQSSKKQRILSGYTVKGRKMICISVSGIKLDIQISKMVCQTFHGLKDESIYDVHHKNGNSTDNRSVNLEWITTRSHRKLHGFGKIIQKISNLKS